MPEVTFVAYDEVVDLDESKWTFIREYAESLRLYRQYAQIDLSREVTNRKARRAAAAAKRRRQ